MTEEEKTAKKEWQLYRDLIAEYLHANYSRHGIAIYTEIALGKTIIGKKRNVDVFVVREVDQRALAIECKFQDSQGTTDEKMPYALADLDALWVPGCLVYGGAGWSPGVLQMLRAARRAAFCEPVRPAFSPSLETRELDHVIASVFGLWEYVLREHRRIGPTGQLLLPGVSKGQRRALKAPKRSGTSGGL